MMHAQPKPFIPIWPEPESITRALGGTWHGRYGLAPMTRQSGQWRGKAFIQGGRALVREALYMPALVAARFNPVLKTVHDRLIAAGKPAKVAITAVMLKLLVLASALLRDQRTWTPVPA